MRSAMSLLADAQLALLPAAETMSIVCSHLALDMNQAAAAATVEFPIGWRAHFLLLPLTRIGA